MKSKLINQEVIHITLGRGIIVDYGNGIIKVAFPSKEMKFQYPAGFEKYLKFADQDMQNAAMIDLHKECEEKRLKQEAKLKELTSITKPVHAQKEKRKVSRNYSKGIKYKDWETLYPNHVIIQKEGFMYQAHNESAEKLSDVLGYELMTDIADRVTTGGPDPGKIGFALENANCSYIIIEDEQIIDQFDAK